jgi:hypothetical protein
MNRGWGGGPAWRTLGSSTLEPAMNKKSLVSLVALSLLGVGAQASVLLYSQNFDNPNTFVNYAWGSVPVSDVDPYTTVNGAYGNQPVGFSFGQAWTVETLLVGGTGAWGGQGFKDPSGTGGKYVLGMLSSVQNDLLGLSFNTQGFRYLNFRFDFSPIDLNTWSGLFNSGKVAPSFRVSLIDNPSGATGLGTGAVLGFQDFVGLAPDNGYTFKWTNGVAALDALNSTNGNVTIRIDMLTGGYGAIDNFVVNASDKIGDVPAIPEPGTYAMMALGLAAVGFVARRRSRLV